MSNVTRVGRFMFDTKTQTEWERLNPVLLKGELVLEYDTKLMKIGDGITKYNRLPYANRGKDGVGVTPEQQEMLEQFDVLLEKSVNKEYLNDKLALYVKEVDISDYISNKADITYVDSELEKKANAADVNSKLESKADKTYVDEKLLNKADTTDLVNYAKISQLDELKAELLLAIEQGSAEAIKVYADIFSVGNSDASDIILNTGKIGLVLKNVTQSELNIWEELTTMEDVVNSEEAFNTVINSTTAMNAVANSTTAMNAVANSTTAMNAVINSTAAWNTVINSTTAMNAVANSTTALKAIADSDKAMMTLSNHSKTRTHTGTSVISINGIVLSTSSYRVEIFSFADGTKTSDTEDLPYKLSNGHYNVLKSYPKRAVSVAAYAKSSNVYYYPLD